MSDLKLLAMDEDDLKVLSAHVQDAIVRVADMGFAKVDQRFALMLNRFAWEHETPTKNARAEKGVRKRAVLRFERVRAAKVAGFDQNAREGVLELLSVRFEPAMQPEGHILLEFAGGGTVRLDVECIEARLRDMGAAWAASAVPVHELSDK